MGKLFSCCLKAMGYDNLDNNSEASGRKKYQQQQQQQQQQHQQHSTGSMFFGERGTADRDSSSNCSGRGDGYGAERGGSGRRFARPQPPDSVSREHGGEWASTPPENERCGPARNSPTSFGMESSSTPPVPNASLMPKGFKDDGSKDSRNKLKLNFDGFKRQSSYKQQH